MAIAVLGIDLGKNSCSVAGLDGTCRVVLRRRLTRESVVRLAGTLPACVVAIESCSGAHHLGRVLRAGSRGAADSQTHIARSFSRQRTIPWIAGIGPLSTIAGRASRWAVFSLLGWPGTGRSAS